MATPSYSVYTVIKRDGPDGKPLPDFWLNIGAAFPHTKGEGMTILLQALPIDGRLVLRKYVEKQDQPPPPEDHDPAPPPPRTGYRDQGRR